MEHVPEKQTVSNARCQDARRRTPPPPTDEYEHVLALQRTAGNQAVVRALSRGRDRALQRYVTDFDATLEKQDPPAVDVKNVLAENEDAFDQDWDEIEDAVDKRLANPLKRTRETPTSVFALLEKPADSMDDEKRPQLPRSKHASANVGAMGSDEFLIRRNNEDEFEGGHLVPHHLFDPDDPQAGRADSYENLVPMSRHTNMNTWQEKERQLDAKFAEIDAGDQLQIGIDATLASSYSLTLQVLADRFGLSLQDAEADGQTIVKLYEWIPEKIGPLLMQHIETGSEDELSEAQDNDLRRPFKRPLETGAEALDVLLKFGVPMTKELQAAMAAMK